MDDIGFHHQVLINELCWVGIVGVYPAHLRRGQINLVWLFLGDEGLHCRLIG
jgi:hypothetical protein